MAKSATLRRLDAAYVEQTKGMRAHVEGFVRSRLEAGEFREADLVRFLNEVLPVIRGARLQMSALTDAYLARVLSEHMGTLVPALGPIDTDALRGVALDEVYTRPFVSARMAIGDGKTMAEAMQAATARATDLVATDMQLAKTHTARATMQAHDFVRGFERRLRGSHSCALCYVASTQRYHRGDLLPIHPGCDCDVAPIVDTGQQVIYPERLQAAHDEVGSRLGKTDPGARAPDYRKQLIVHEHGEIGPVLAVRGQSFTGPSDI